jgi:ATP-dependent Clp protease adaptor protein ClpS
MAIGLLRGNGRRPYRSMRLIEDELMADERQAQAENPVESADASATATITKQKEKRRKKPKRLPPYHVLLWNDDDHSFAYVIAMMQTLFGHPPTKGYQIAEEVHLRGRAIVLTTTKEHAELKRDQIHAFGKDDLIAGCRGSMSASIEPSIG